MTRYADPHRCPDCRGPITYGTAACPTCGLVLAGETAQRLFTTLSAADDLLAALRAGTARSTVPATAGLAAGSVGDPPAPTGTVLTAPPDTAPFPAPHQERRRRAGLSAASVPQILLGLGAVCLLVAALVFLAVTWSVLGVGGRTATLVGFTVVAGGLTRWLAGRGLRGAAEALSLVAFGLLTLDVVGADHAGWFGELSGTGLLLVLGATLTAAGGVTALAVRRIPGAALVSPELVAVVGTALASGAVGSGEWFSVSASLVAATLVGAAATGAAHVLGLRLGRGGAAALTALAWLTLTLQALLRTLDQETWHALWGGREVWPLVVAAALAAAPAFARRLTTGLRVAALAVGQALLAVAVLAPVLRLGDTLQVLVGVALLLVTGAATRLLPRPWGGADLATQGMAALGVLAAALGLVGEATVRVAHAVEDVWAATAGGSFPPVATGLPAGWLLPVCVAALAGTLWASGPTVSALLGGSGTPSGTAPWWTVAAGAVLAGLVGALTLYPVPVWLVLGAALLVSVAGLVWWASAPSPVPLALATAFLGGALTISLYAEWLTAVALVVATVATGLVHLRARGSELAAAAGVAFAAAVAGSVWTWGAVADGAAEWVVLSALLTLAVVAVGVAYLPSGWWATGEPGFARSGVEAGAAAVAVPLGLAGVMLAPGAQDATWAAAYLTVAGVTVTVISLLHADRRRLGWAGGALLALASWVRLWDLGVQEPEAYTLPSAAALLAVGLLHLRRNPGGSTMTALAPGLSLALVPSLLWTLSDPVGPRPLLLGLACLGLVLTGVRLGWTAPLALGATVGGVLVLRLAAPYLGDAVPRWVLIGGAGALLIAVGATWESRLQEARHVMSYVRTLR